MSLSLEDVKHVASLARLGMTDEELSTFQEQLSSILDHIEVLNELDTDNIPPTAQVGQLENVVRADEVRESFPQEVITRLAPHTHDGFIAVPAVMGGTDEGGSA